jgi:ubiquinone/menaquinone biosynthesis C-methylase UbiE
MTSTQRLSTIASIYDKRAPTYDSEGGFHVRQAQDFIEWMSLSPGLKVLDLACGTGPITIPAAKIVGPTGKTVGVDISGESISIAKSKAEEENVNVQFIHHDIAALPEIPEIKEGEFDVITCASAFVLLEDPGSVVKGWSRFLKVGGRLIFDMPTYNAMIGGWVMNIVGQKMGIRMAYNRNDLDALEKVKPLLVEAGLDASETFVTESYDGSNIDPKNAGEMFEGIVGKKEWYDDVYAAVQEPGKKEEAKELFIREVEKLADESGIVREDRRFTMAIGKRVR